MKKILYIYLIILFPLILEAQDVNETAMGIPRVDNVTSITGEAAANTGNIVYNNADNLIYRYNGTTWVVLENAAEVPLVTNVDVNNVTGDPGAVVETNVEDVIQAIAPITSKAGRVFFPPSIEINASSTVDNAILDLYALYTAQYGTPTAKSPAAPATIPVYAANELYYYVTLADPLIFNIDSISDAGVMQYDIIALPTNDNTIINVVFVVK